MQEINSIAFLRLLRPSTRGVGVYVGIAFAKLFGMRGFTTAFDDYTNITSNKFLCRRAFTNTSSN